jgi:hypothetical protein
MMSAPELYQPVELPNTEAMDAYSPGTGQTFKKLFVKLAGGSDSFFPGDEPGENGITDWAQWTETADLRIEWAEHAKLADLRANPWFARMELGHAPDDVVHAMTVRMPEIVLDVPSFIPRWPTIIPEIEAEAVAPEIDDPAAAAVIDLTAKRLEHDAALPADKLGINRRTTLVATRKIVFKEPVPAILDPFTGEPEPETEPTTPQEEATEKGQSPESQQRVEFVLDVTRVELIASLAEQLAKPNGRLLHHLALRKAIDTDAAHRSLLQDKDFIGLLKRYGVGREGFIAFAHKNRQHPKYESIVLQSPTRAAYLSKHNADDMLTSYINTETPV